MKTLKITLLAAIFCTTLTGLSIQSDENVNPTEENVTQKEDFTIVFTSKKHVKKSGEIPPAG